MGFNAGFSIVKRASGCSFDEMVRARKHTYNNFLKSHYKSYENYAETTSSFEKDVYQVVTKYLIDFYTTHRPIDIYSWGSMAKRFDEDIRRLSKQNNSGYFEINHEALEKLYKYAKQKVEELEFVPITITHGIQQIENDKDGAKEKLIPIDGVRIKLEDGSIRQLHNEYYFDTMFVSKSLADAETVYLFQSLLDCVYNLKQYDTRDWFIYYRCD